VPAVAGSLGEGPVWRRASGRDDGLVGNRHPAGVVWWAMVKPTDRRLVAAGLASALVLAACSGGLSPTATALPATTVPSATPAGSPAASPTPGTGTIAHPVGATDLVLRFDEGGGFVAPTFAMIQVPYFSLYGDGTVIYRPASAPWPEQKPGEPMRLPPLQVAKMAEDQVQALLRDALGDGGLGVARARYENNQVADAPTAAFTVNADGRQRRVSAYALGMAIDDPANPNPDAAILGAMATFAERLRNFDQEIAKGNGTAAGFYLPNRFRASILEGGAGGDGPPRSWPWPTFGPDGFTTVDQGTGFGFPSRAISGLEMSLLGIKKPEGGVSGISLRAPNGTVYGLGIRPLLPDEQR